MCLVQVIPVFIFSITMISLSKEICYNEICHVFWKEDRTLCNSHIIINCDIVWKEDKTLCNLHIRINGDVVWKENRTLCNLYIRINGDVVWKENRTLCHLHTSIRINSDKWKVNFYFPPLDQMIGGILVSI